MYSYLRVAPRSDVNGGKVVVAIRRVLPNRQSGLGAPVPTFGWRLQSVPSNRNSGPSCGPWTTASNSIRIQRAGEGNCRIFQGIKGLKWQQRKKIAMYHRIRCFWIGLPVLWIFRLYDTFYGVTGVLCLPEQSCIMFSLALNLHLTFEWLLTFFSVMFACFV